MQARNQTKPIANQKKPIGYQMVSIANQTKPKETNCQESKSKSRESKSKNKRKIKSKELRVRERVEAQIAASNNYLSPTARVSARFGRPCKVMTGLRKARLERGLTLMQVAKDTFYSYGALARAERGSLYVGNKDFKARAEFWAAMSKYYDKTVEELKEVYK